MGEFVRIFEMAPRDGLQNEGGLIPTAAKIRLVDMLSECGFQKIEATSFVSPKWVPQMADAAGVMAGIRRKAGVAYTALVPNLKGYEAAQAAGVSEVALFASASEAFSRRNINCSIAESLERFQPVLAAAATDGIPVRGYVSCVTDCPYEGSISPEAVAKVATELLKMGCYEISLGDTIGHGTPATIAAMLDAVLTDVPPERLAGHYHDTRARALDNVLVSLERGLRSFDAAVGGLGGCPYAPGAKGNVDTLAVANLLATRGYETGLNLKQLGDAAGFAASLRRD
ncbi:hydroxymethylglutaryl-CoA lyase [Mesorhizobium sp. WSM3866]|uniref:hydroxymethylglutaryl-CoA lyase n=1 Tax=Mesorhizobium sp. WSM3866 TaxID=422271 RepID=UPI000BB09B6E|nr:hydroxymethylglutaryl-CoA lyase [Mesorhizobium sp. WSM3866]PBB41195.1 hydroxymethylglutaryl-CoA lyase [Mesorhizobium sp. WSM3866]